MDVFIPIHYACHFLSVNNDQSRCPVLSDLPTNNTMDESFLYLDTNVDRIDFDIQIGENGGLVLAELAFHHAKRLYEDSTLTQAEEYTKRGTDIANSLHFGSTYEYLAAWINETRKQHSLIRDIDMVLSLNILRKSPQWVRHDLFLILEAEAMKHIFAQRFRSYEHGPALPRQLRESITKNASNGITPIISTLMNTLFQRPLSYDGSGQKFINEYNQIIEDYQSI